MESKTQNDDSAKVSTGTEDATPMTSSKPIEEAVALAAMQEAATILMEADQKKRSAEAAPESLSTADTGNTTQNNANASNKRARTSSTRVPWETRLEQLSEYKVRQKEWQDVEWLHKLIMNLTILFAFFLERAWSPFNTNSL